MLYLSFDATHVIVITLSRVILSVEAVNSSFLDTRTFRQSQLCHHDPLYRRGVPFRLLESFAVHSISIPYRNVSGALASSLVVVDVRF